MITFEEINARHFEDYAREKGINIDKQGNLQCINADYHKHGDNNPSMRIYAGRTQATLFHLSKNI